MTIAHNNGVLTRYTYDDWGRTVATRSGKDGFDYLYRFGNYLKRADRIADAALAERVYYIKTGSGGAGCGRWSR